jgi:hypothetical protein
MSETRSLVDISGQWFLGAVKADTVQIGAGGVFTVDNTTTPASVTVNDVPILQDYLFATQSLGVLAPLPNDSFIPFLDGAVSVGTSIVQEDEATFRLEGPGTYEVAWQLPITGITGQVGLFLLSGTIEGGPAAGNIIPRTIVGQAQGLIQLSSRNLIKVNSATAVIVLMVASGGPITLTASAGGPNSVRATMSIIRTF